MKPKHILTVARLDHAEVRRSRWLPFMLVVYACLGGAFVLVGLRESMVLGFSGTGRIMVGITHAMLVVLPLLALSATAQVVNQARTNGLLELLLAQPLPREAFFLAVTLSRMLLLCVPLAALFLGLGLFARVAFQQPIPWSILVRSIAVSWAILVAYVGLGMWISTLIVDTGKATIAILLAWCTSIALLDFVLIGVLLSWRVEPHVVFLLAAANPVESARLGLLSGMEASLTTLGPVGMYLSTRLGPSKLLAVGIAWPCLFGTILWFSALRSFVRKDVV